VFSYATGEFLREVGRFRYPHGMAIMGRSLLVADYCNDRIAVISLDDGSFLTSFSVGDGCGPRSVAFDAFTNRIFVFTSRVCVFDASNFSRLSAFGEFGLKGHVIVDDVGQIFVSQDAWKIECISVFARDLSYVRHIRMGAVTSIPQ